MNGVIGAILPLAVGIAVSPIPIIAVILMLFSAKAGATSTGFLIGWLLGIIVAAALFTALAGVLHTGGPTPAWVAWTEVVLGLALLLLGVKQWRARGGIPRTPSWMAAIDRFTAAKALGLGFVLSAINPKNLLMAVAAGVAIGSAGLDLGQIVVAISVFTVIAGCTVAAPVIAYAVAKDRLRAPLDSAKAWLQANNTTVMCVLFLVLGAVVLGKGIGAL